MARVTFRSDYSPTRVLSILWGFLLHALLYAAVGRAKEVGPMLWGLAALSAGLLVLGH